MNINILNIKLFYKNMFSFSKIVFAVCDSIVQKNICVNCLLHLLVSHVAKTQP